MSFDDRLLLLFNSDGNVFLDSVMLTLTSGFTWIPLYLGLLIIVIKNNESLVQVLWAITCFLLCVGFSDVIADFIVKPSVARLRPCNEPSLAGIVRIVNGYTDNSYSFFSAHASNTMSIAVLGAWLIRSRLLTTALVSWSLLNCYTRLYLAMHYPTDIIVGLICGVLVGSLTYMLYIFVYRRMTHSPRFVSSHYTRTGYSLADVGVTTLLIISSILYAIISATYKYEL